MTTLQNKTALVTGASRGIRRATAAALAEAGAHVLVHYGRSKQEAESLVAEIQRQHGHAEAISADLGIPVYYFPRSDTDMSLLVRTTHYTYCPYKGDCSYYSIPVGGSRSENAV